MQAWGVGSSPQNKIESQSVGSVQHCDGKSGVSGQNLGYCGSTQGLRRAPQSVQSDPRLHDE
ncbi:MAG: hypothetical protein IPG81_31510 [Sandaracinaceae bacterium]|nr:hypothetical protein [Sandaracinaceae bacterium]